MFFLPAVALLMFILWGGGVRAYHWCEVGVARVPNADGDERAASQP